MTNVFTDEARHDPAGPVTLTPKAAHEGGPDSSGGTSAGVDFFVTLGATLGTIADQLTQDRADREGRCPPGDQQLFAAAVVPASGSLLLDLGSVPLGRVWEVRWLNVGGVTITTAAAGKAYIFCQGGPPTDLNITNCRENLQTLPPAPVPRYGTHQFFMRATEHLWVVLVGATAGQQYAATARIEDWPDGDHAAGFVE